MTAYPVPACTAARASIVTGVYPRNGNWIIQAYKDRQFTGLTTLADHLKAHGYTTLMAGKVFPPMEDSAHWDSYEHFPRSLEEKVGETRLNGVADLPGHDPLDWGERGYQLQEMSDFAIQEWAVSALGRTYEKPFFLAVGFRSPHLPWYMPKEYLNRYPIEKVELPYVDSSDLEDVPLPGKLVAWWSPIRKVARFEDSDHHKIVEANQWHWAVQAYSAASSFVDERIGAVLDTLYNSKHANNTVVILFSDHGWQLGEKQKWRKMALWEDATRVPLVVSYPARLPQGVTSSIPVSLIDIFPTILDLAELPRPDHDMDGSSLLSAMEGPDETRCGVVTTFMGHHAVRTKRYRYIRYANGDAELYDHAHDSMEHRNLLAVQAERTQHTQVATALDSCISQLHPRRDRKYIEEAREDAGTFSLDH